MRKSLDRSWKYKLKHLQIIVCTLTKIDHGDQNISYYSYKYDNRISHFGIRYGVFV